MEQERADASAADAAAAGDLRSLLDELTIAVRDTQMRVAGLREGVERHLQPLDGLRNQIVDGLVASARSIGEVASKNESDLAKAVATITERLNARLALNGEAFADAVRQAVAPLDERLTALQAGLDAIPANQESSVSGDRIETLVAEVRAVIDAIPAAEDMVPPPVDLSPVEAKLTAELGRVETRLEKLDLARIEERLASVAAAVESPRPQGTETALAEMLARVDELAGRVEQQERSIAAAVAALGESTAAPRPDDGAAKAIAPFVRDTARQLERLMQHLASVTGEVASVREEIGRRMSRLERQLEKRLTDALREATPMPAPAPAAAAPAAAAARSSDPLARGPVAEQRVTSAEAAAKRRFSLFRRRKSEAPPIAQRAASDVVEGARPGEPRIIEAEAPREPIVASDAPPVETPAQATAPKRRRATRDTPSADPTARKAARTQKPAAEPPASPKAAPKEVVQKGAPKKAAPKKAAPKKAAPKKAPKQAAPMEAAPTKGAAKKGAVKKPAVKPAAKEPAPADAAPKEAARAQTEGAAASEADERARDANSTTPD